MSRPYALPEEDEGMRLSMYHLDRIIAAPERIPSLTAREVILLCQSFALLTYSQASRDGRDTSAGHALWVARELAGAWLAAHPAAPKSDHHRYAPWGPEHAATALDRASKLLRQGVETDAERLDVARGILCRLTLVAAREGLDNDTRSTIAAGLRVLGAPS